MTVTIRSPSHFVKLSHKKSLPNDGKLYYYAFLRKALRINEMNKMTRNTHVIAAPGGAS